MSDSGGKGLKAMVLVKFSEWMGILAGFLPPISLNRSKRPSPKDLLAFVAACLAALAPPTFDNIYLVRYR